MTEASFLRDKLIPVTTILIVIIAHWYALAVFLNAPFERDQAARAGTEISFSTLAANTMHQDRPVLPAPHQAGRGNLEKRVWRQAQFQAQPRLSMAG
jgi:NitT/TauT family transport system permease protein